MIKQFLRAILLPREDDGRIAAIESRLSNVESVQENLMARIDELAAIVTDVANVVDAVVAHVNDLNARLAVAGAEDPRVGEAVDALNAIRGRLTLAMPPVGAPAA